MICVYPADCTDFSTNGIGTISPLTAEVTETLNGEYELTVVHPIDDEGKYAARRLRQPLPGCTFPCRAMTAAQRFIESIPTLQEQKPGKAL